MPKDLNSKNSKTYLPRDISWMYFNHRILQEAQKEQVPLLERLSFLGIYSNNLDEFFRVRVASQNRVAECEEKEAKTDREVEILDFYSQNDHRVQVFRLTQNMGAGAARNNSISRAKGRYIAFCDSDDRWLPTKLERQIEYMQKKNCCMSFSSYILCDQEGVEKGIVIAPVRLTLRMLMHDNKVGCLTAVYDTQRFGKFYMPTLRKRQDWGLFLMILQKCKVAYGIQKPLVQRIYTLQLNLNF